jgi:predicted CXXCH cytochrome family protein
MLFGFMLLACVAAAIGSPAPEPRGADNAAFLQPLWHVAPVAPDPVRSPGPPTEIPLHHFDLPCDTCHEAAGASEPGKDGDGWRVTSGINRGCTSSACHDYEPILNHPIGVAVPESVPRQMPLDRLSRITCLTCHVPAGGQPPRTDQDRRTSVLLGPGSDLCASCHLRMNAAGGKLAHWRFSMKAHLGNVNPLSGRENRVDIPLGRIDEESMACLNCHDDITVTIPGENETRQEQVARWARMKDHPIGMDYRSIAASGPAFFNYPGPTTDHVRLFDDRVGCGSCHSPYARNSDSLTVADHGALCRTCHIR